MAEVVLDGVTKRYQNGPLKSRVRALGSVKAGPANVGSAKAGSAKAGSAKAGSAKAGSANGNSGDSGRTENGVPRQSGAAGFGVEELSLQVADREFLVLVGPSGCGKSTTLRLIAGLETASSGRILIGGRDVTALAPAKRDIAMVFQNYALYPHMTVYGNLAFGLRLRYGGGIGARLLRRLVDPRRAAELSVQRRGIEQRVRQAAERLGILHLLDRKPHELSGGERQRVALGRAIVRNPAAFLFDEPLSNLDAKLRQQMRIELKQLHQGLAATTIYVTHDQVEAMTLGQRVAVMDRGRLQQVGSPEEIYDSPANLFVAGFFGSTPINLLPGQLQHGENGVEFVGERFRWNLGPERSAGCRDWPRQVTLGLRGEDLQIVASQTVDERTAVDEGRVEDPSGDPSGDPNGGLNARQRAAEYGAGGEIRWRLPLLTVRQVDNWGDAQVVTLGCPADGGAGRTAADGLELVAKLPVAGGVTGAGTSGPGPLRLRPGDVLTLVAAAGRCHWFDTVTGMRLDWRS